MLSFFLNHVYVLIALEHGEVKETVVVTNLLKAKGTKKKLSTIYGAGNVVFASRIVNDVPKIIREFGK
jgi:hypothetical protein